MKKTVVHKDFPFKDVVKQADIILATRDCDVYQKFTCAKCGQRLTIEQPNVMHRTGTCDQCGHVTNIELQGCNFLVVTRFEARNKVQGKDDASESHESKTGDSDWLSSKRRK